MQLRRSQTFEAFPENQLHITTRHRLCQNRRYGLVLVYVRPSLCIKLFLEHSLHSLLRRSLISWKSCVYQKSREDKKSPYAYSSLGLFAIYRTSQILKYIELTQWLRSKNCLGMEFHVQYVLKSCSKMLFIWSSPKNGDDLGFCMPQR